MVKVKSGQREKQEENSLYIIIFITLCIRMAKTLTKRSKKSYNSRKKSIKKIKSFKEYEKVGEQIITSIFEI